MKIEVMVIKNYLLVFRLAGGKTHGHKVLRLASSIKYGTVSASLMMKKLASHPKQNGLAKALREIRRIER